MADAERIKQRLKEDRIPEAFWPYQRPEPFDQYFSEGGAHRHAGKVSRIAGKMNREQLEQMRSKR